MLEKYKSRPVWEAHTSPFLCGMIEGDSPPDRENTVARQNCFR